MEEIFDVCDEEDRVIGQAPRSVVHARRLLHRAVHVFVVNSAGQLLLQQRSAAKDEFPLCYTSSASGHLAAGEDYAAAAARELQEELGLALALRPLHKFKATPQTSYEHTMLYLARTDQTPRPDSAEIASLVFSRPWELPPLIAEAPERFSVCFLTLFEWFLQRAERHLRESGW
jgi:16S rRNA (adenine1518-N6/adenine1519-N6)-dimethyltransferase